MNNPWGQIEHGGTLKAYAATSTRNHQIGALTVDVVERDVADGKMNLNVIVFKSPEVGRDVCESAITKTCKQIFGNRNYIDLIYRDEAEIKRKENLPSQVNAFDSWIIEVLHPRSMLFSVDHLKGVCLTILNQNLSS
jgi:hypothetical protein